MEVKEESEKVGLKLNIQKMKIMASGPITSWEIRWGNSGNSVRLYFLGSKITADGDCCHGIKVVPIPDNCQVNTQCLYDVMGLCWKS